MPKLDPQDVMRDARKLRDERFSTRITQLQERAKERFNQTAVEIPEAYRLTTAWRRDGNGKVTNGHPSNILNDEGRQITTLVYAIPVPHLPAPSPEMQAQTTKVEQFLIAMHENLEDHYGPVWQQCTSAQVHDNLGWIYFAPKRNPYNGHNGQPLPPDDDAPYEDHAEYTEKNESFKRDAGIASVFDYEYATTATVLYEGPVYDPKCVYVWKEVPRSTFKKTYGDRENVTGRPEGQSTSESMITVIEYWDKTSCLIFTESSDQSWHEKLRRMEKGVVRLDEWDHNWGRVPYFARPCFVTDQLDEDKKYEGPLDGIYIEMPNHKRWRMMCDSVAYQTAFSPLKITTAKDGEMVMDSAGQPAVFLKFVPGEARQLAPGQDVAPVGQSPEVQNLFLEMARSTEELQRFMLSPVSKGISPGADTANSALSNLHRFQLHSMDPMARETSRQGKAMYRFALEWLKKSGEPHYAFDAKSDQHIALSASDIVSLNVQAKATPDQGQFQLLIDKHAMEMYLSGVIPEQEMHEMRGKENPEEHVKANMVERLRKTLEPVIIQQIVADLGMMDAVNEMIRANAETGDARNAIPGLEQQGEMLDEGQAPTGMGSGSLGQPRDAGVRQSVQDVNTAPEVLSAGY